MAKMGRPNIEIDKSQFESLCNLQCTLLEIAAFFKCSDDTIENWCKKTYFDEDGNPMTFSEVFKVYSVGGKISLRRFQFKQAEKSYAMAIWLGKQWLGQKDNSDISLAVSDKSGEVAALDEYFKHRNEETTA